MKSKKCSKCGEVKGIEFFSPRKDRASGRRSHCKMCVNEYGKLYRDNFYIIKMAQRLARTAEENGDIFKPRACDRCDKEGNVEKHHEDYSKPLSVIWLCRKCHRRRHMELKYA